MSQKLKEETASAQSHNINSEELMGMFSSAKQKCPHATMCYLSCRMRACKNRTVQYLDSTSARSHNIDTEELMGMLSSAKQKCRHATMCYLSCRMRACKNQYLDSLQDDRQEEVLHKAVKWGRLQRNRRKLKQSELRAEIIKKERENKRTCS